MLAHIGEIGLFRPRISLSGCTLASMHSPLAGKTILVTGGTGSFGQTFTQYALAQGAGRIHIVSRDEVKQAAMQATLPDPDDRIRYFLGDVRDRDRMLWVSRGCDIVVHTAALKRIEKCAYDPWEAVETNVRGTWNVLWAALQNAVERVIVLSSDKATLPWTHYGHTKAVAESLTLNANAYLGGPARFTVVRYGNVAGSRGSIIPLWRDLSAQGQPLPVTDVRMTRFWITLDDAVRFVAHVCTREPGKIYVPRMPSFKVVDLALAIQGPDGPPFRLIGLRGIEKLHEDLVAEHEADYVIGAPTPWRSDLNDCWLTTPQLRHFVASLAPHVPA